MLSINKYNWRLNYRNAFLTATCGKTRKLINYVCINWVGTTNCNFNDFGLKKVHNT